MDLNQTHISNNKAMGLAQASWAQPDLAQQEQDKKKPKAEKKLKKYIDFFFPSDSADYMIEATDQKQGTVVYG